MKFISDQDIAIDNIVTSKEKQKKKREKRIKVKIGKYAWIYGLNQMEIVRLKKLLTIYPQKVGNFSKTTPDPIKLYSYGSDGSLGIARSYFLKHLNSFDAKIYDRTNDGKNLSDNIRATAKFTGHFKEQRKAIDTLHDFVKRKKAGGMILQAGVGTGKTVMGLNFAYEHGKRTAILVHKEFLMNQWKERIKTFLPGASVGIVQRRTCQYKNDFVIFMVQSIVKGRYKKYPKDLFDDFGLVITDEVHRTSAPTWCEAIVNFPAKWRLGLTATPRRKDGAEDVFFNHVGEICYKLKKRSMKPEIKRVLVKTNYESAFVKSKHGGKYEVSAQNMSPAQHLNYLAEHKERNKAIMRIIIKALLKDRKVFVVSERKSQLKMMAEMMESTKKVNPKLKNIVYDFYVGSWFTGKKVERTIEGKKRKVDEEKKRTDMELELASRANLIFSTKQMVSEALDIPAIDVLVLATPTSDAEQTIGRARRFCVPNDDFSNCKKYCQWRAGRCKGKERTIIVDIIDYKMEFGRRKWYSRSKHYFKLGAITQEKRMLPV